MVKPAEPGIYSATYSNIPVWEYQFGVDLKEHVMRRRYDDYINATHILKAAGFDKPARTRILEREVQKGEHEKVQGGYGKYQGTWVPLASGAELARRNNVYDKLAPIFEFVSGNVSPPPAPKHTTSKPKQAKKPAVPKFNSRAMAPPIVAQQAQQAQQMQMDQDDYYDNMSVQYDQTPDDVTVASYAEEDVYNQSAPLSQRKRKREPDFGQQQQQQVKTSAIDQAHIIYSDELLDYFMLAQKAQHADRPEPPANFNPDWHIDSDGHTALHWAASMGDLEVMKQLKSFNANIDARNIRGETPLMRAMIFTNCMDKQTCPKVAQELIATVKSQDNNGKTAIHHAADLTQYRTKQHCARYYLDVLLNKVCEVYDPDDVQHILDIQDIEGNTAAHIAANNKARKCLRALMGRGANIEIPNIHGRRVEELIPELNQSRRPVQALSSSPYAPQSHRRNFSYPEPSAPTPQLNLTSVLQNARKESHHSEAAQTLSTKVGPSVNAKLEDLKNSYNQELQERENSEKEARRILAQTQADLAAVQRLIEEFGEGGEDKAGAKNEVSQLSRAQGMVVSLVEQQQAILLSQKVAEFEKMGVNGDDVEMGENGDLETMGRLLDELREQQVKRTKLVGEYIAALADRGVGEKADMYRRLTANCLSVEEKMVDSRIDEILVSLEEENEGLE